MAARFFAPGVVDRAAKTIPVFFARSSFESQAHCGAALWGCTRLFGPWHSLAFNLHSPVFPGTGDCGVPAQVPACRDAAWPTRLVILGPKRFGSSRSRFASTHGSTKLRTHAAVRHVAPSAFLVLQAQFTHVITIPVNPNYVRIMPAPDTLRSTLFLCLSAASSECCRAASPRTAPRSLWWWKEWRHRTATIPCR